MTEWNLTFKQRLEQSAYGRHLMNDPCPYCGGPSSAVDHIVPQSQGGDHDLANLVPVCMSCNSAKGKKSLLGFLGYKLWIRDELREVQARARAWSEVGRPT